MKKYAVLVIVIAAAFGTLSATFDSFSPGQQEQPIILENEGQELQFDHSDGFGCAYGAEV